MIPPAKRRDVRFAGGMQKNPERMRTGLSAGG